MGIFKEDPAELIKEIIEKKKKILEERAKKQLKDDRLRILGLSKRILNNNSVLETIMIHEVCKKMKEYHPATIEKGLIYWAKKGELVYENNEYSLSKKIPRGYKIKNE